MTEAEYEKIRKNQQKRMREDAILKQQAKFDLLRDVVKFLDTALKDATAYEERHKIEMPALQCTLKVFLKTLEKHSIVYDEDDEAYYYLAKQENGDIEQTLFFK